MDPKEIGFAAKDIIIGIAGAAAGASGGPAAAEGVMKAGSGVDRILAMALPEEKKTSRAEKFDRADFGARPATSPPKSPAPVSQPPPAPILPQPVPQAPLQKPQGGEGPLSGDAKIAWDHLRDIGWPNARIQQILAGPEQSSLAAITGRETKGFRIRGVQGIRPPQVEGTAVPLRTGRLIPPVAGEPVPLVRGTRVKDDIGEV